MTTYQQCYCKSDDPPHNIQEYHKLCLFTQDHCPHRNVILYSPLSNFPNNAAMTPIGVIQIFSNPGILNSFSITLKEQQFVIQYTRRISVG